MERKEGTAFCAHACTPKIIVKSHRFAVHSRGHDDPVPTRRSVLDGKVSAYAGRPRRGESAATLAFQIQKAPRRQHHRMAQIIAQPRLLDIGRDRMGAQYPWRITMQQAVHVAVQQIARG